MVAIPKPGESPNDRTVDIQRKYNISTNESPLSKPKKFGVQLNPFIPNDPFKLD